jgi:hypothetical protein
VYVCLQNQLRRLRVAKTNILDLRSYISIKFIIFKNLCQYFFQFELRTFKMQLVASLHRFHYLNNLLRAKTTNWIFSIQSPNQVSSLHLPILSFRIEPNTSTSRLIEREIKGRRPLQFRLGSASLW